LSGFLSVKNLEKRKGKLEKDFEHCQEGLREAKDSLGKKMWEQNTAVLKKDITRIDNELVFRRKSK
jgi:hypothetical protein